MTWQHALRVVIFALGVIAIGGSLDAMAIGPGRGMRWSQFMRYTSWVILILTVLAVQWTRRNHAITWVTWACFAGVLTGALGVWSELRRPIKRR